MKLNSWILLAIAGWIVVSLAADRSPADAQAPAVAAALVPAAVAVPAAAAHTVPAAAAPTVPAAAAPTVPAAAAPAAPPIIPPGAVVRRVVMKDALSVEQFHVKLDALKASGLFRDTIAGPDPKKPVPVEISFLSSGNFLLVIGSHEWVDQNLDAIRLMAFLFERPRAHLEMNLRVVQLSGPANADVIQMSETVKALVDARRDDIVRTFSDLAEYATRRIRRHGKTLPAVYQAARELLPTLGSPDRPLTVPEILLLLMLDRSAPEPNPTKATDEAADDASTEIETALLALPRALTTAMQDPHRTDLEIAKNVSGELAAWKQAVIQSRDWCLHYADDLKNGKGGDGIGALKTALRRPSVPLPSWLVHQLLRSIRLTERLYPGLARQHTESSLRELARRLTTSLERAEVIEKALIAAQAPPPTDQDNQDDQSPDTDQAKKKGKKKDGPPPIPGGLGRNLVALNSLSEELIPAPFSILDVISSTTEGTAPSAHQMAAMFHAYAEERRKLDRNLADDAPDKNRPTVNYARLEALEAGMNLWLRRVSEAMARALDQQFYRRYVEEVRLLANKQLGKTSNREIMDDVSIDQVSDVARDLLLQDSGVNIFVSNSISLQFAPDTTNSVSAQVQAPIPSRVSLADRLAQAATATTNVQTISQAYGISGQAMVQAILSGGEAVPVQSGITLTAMPSIGFDAGTVTLSLTANQTLEPDNEQVADRVTTHSINNATVTAISYEPMVLSTLASNTSYYENSGGIPLLRKTPFVNGLLKDVPFAPFKQGKRQKGIYQSSVIILEPVVIPTIEDLVRYHAGWSESVPADDAVTAAALIAAGELPGEAPKSINAAGAPAPTAPAKPGAPTSTLPPAVLRGEIRLPR